MIAASCAIGGEKLRATDGCLLHEPLKHGAPASMTSTLAHLSAISLFVEKLAEAKQFYQLVFDAAVVYEDEVSVALRFDNVILNLLHVGSAGVLIEPGKVAPISAGIRCQFSIWIDDVDARCAELVTKGVKLLTGPRDQPWGMRTATFVDPAGHSWELAQKK
jgi:uncharacterized glyoxalase superfamily protein PhnB